MSGFFEIRVPFARVIREIGAEKRGTSKQKYNQRERNERKAEVGSINESDEWASNWRVPWNKKAGARKRAGAEFARDSA